MESLYRQGNTDMRPDVRVYARVISAYFRSRQKGSDYSAIRLVRSMERYAKSGCEECALAKPNVVIYNTMISSYCRRGDAMKALQVLNQMDDYNVEIQNDEDKIIADEHR